MKLTKETLKQIIKEELNAVLNESNENVSKIIEYMKSGPEGFKSAMQLADTMGLTQEVVKGMINLIDIDDLREEYGTDEGNIDYIIYMWDWENGGLDDDIGTPDMELMLPRRRDRKNNTVTYYMMEGTVYWNNLIRLGEQSLLRYMTSALGKSPIPGMGLYEGTKSFLKQHGQLQNMIEQHLQQIAQVIGGRITFLPGEIQVEVPWDL